MTSLPISLDVTVNVTQAQAAIAYDMTLACIVVPGLTPVVNRIQFFTDYNSALASTTPGSSLDWALKAFFAQTPHPNGVAVGEVDAANDFIAEVELIKAAAIASGKPIYGWILDRTYRDTSHQEAFATWALAQQYAIAPLVTNNALAYDTSDETNIAHFVQTLGGVGRCRPIYHDNAQYYPDMSILALMLAVDYAATNSTIDAQYKDLPGIPTVAVTATQLTNLMARNCSTFISEGNGNRCYRDAVSSGGWYFDTVVNLDNLQNEMSTAVFNVRLQNGKVPYTLAGQLMDVGAITGVLNQYTRNDTLAPRDVANASGNGFKTLPAYIITPSPVGGATVSQRAARTSPPITVTGYESGSQRQITINVNAVQ